MPVILAPLTIFLTFFQGLWQLLKNPHYRSILFWFCMLLLAGTLFYSWAEGWSLVDACYFSVVTLATIGYGDLAPTTTTSRIFTIVYVLMGLSIFVSFVNLIARERHLLREIKPPGWVKSEEESDNAE